MCVCCVDGVCSVNGIVCLVPAYPKVTQFTLSACVSHVCRQVAAWRLSRIPLLLLRNTMWRLIIVSRGVVDLGGVEMRQVPLIMGVLCSMERLLFCLFDVPLEGVSAGLIIM